MKPTNKMRDPALRVQPAVRTGLTLCFFPLCLDRDRPPGSQLSGAAAETGACADLSWNQRLVWWYWVWPEPRWAMWQWSWVREAEFCVDGLFHSLIRWRVCVNAWDWVFVFFPCTCTWTCAAKAVLLFWISLPPTCDCVPCGRFPSGEAEVIFKSAVIFRKERKKIHREENEKLCAWFGTGSAALNVLWRQTTLFAGWYFIQSLWHTAKTFGRNDICLFHRSIYESALKFPL